ncbi:hypothetical protein M5689_011322 [Euphorbia peplus]|nr:hypothetical protein M5689_011322 [Euphorbia peplus]
MYSLPFLLLQPLFLILIISPIFPSSHADVGTAARYSPPYLPTRCYGDDASEFPTNNMFAAAGDGIWDNGASCGREYLVRCISATVAGSCQPNQTIQVKIIDYALSTPTQPSSSATSIIVLSETAFATIANPSADSINIEFKQV